MTTSKQQFFKYMRSIFPEIKNFGILPSDLPGPDTPLPPTNATIHILEREDGYGTSERKFTMLCGVSYYVRERTGEHKYFHASETWWHKHVNCDECREKQSPTTAP